MSDSGLQPPMALLAELTHRCPLRCAYCSNPLELEAAANELTTRQWQEVLTQAAEIGVLQVHFSGGEPAARRDLVDLTAHASSVGLYPNLITSGLGLDAKRLDALAKAGLEHVQLGLQDVEEDGAAFVTGVAGMDRGAEGGGLVARKLDIARQVIEAGLALTINAVMTRHNAERVDRMIDTALALGAGRIEIANVQYYGWGLVNRAALMPTYAQMEAMTAMVEAARERLKGVILIDYVIPDYYARRPKACMGGWGRRFININPAGRVLPCHAAETIPGLVFDNVTQRPLAEIWSQGQAFQRYRGDNGLPAACRACDRKTIDWGGCRCQTLALAGDAGAVDPTCELSPHHSQVAAMAAREATENRVPVNYRAMLQI